MMIEVLFLEELFIQAHLSMTANLMVCASVTMDRGVFF